MTAGSVGAEGEMNPYSDVPLRIQEALDNPSQVVVFVQLEPGLVEWAVW